MQKQLREYVEKATPIAQPEAIIQGKNYRFTILTDRLIRLEYQKEGRFTDQVTQRIVSRNFPVPGFRTIDEPDRLEIITDRMHLYYNKQEFSGEGLMIQLNEGYAVYGSIWRYGDELRDLKGTARTLDNVKGAVELEPGLMSRDGFAVLDDSESAVLTETGEVKARSFEEIDLYFFGYGHDYLECLQDFYRLSGNVPMLPRYTMGNWWSRFYAYTEESYLKLMDEFKRKQIPISTAVIDMDWHLTQLPEKYGSGWTGYTWNPEYFPDPARFMSELHKRGLHVTLNVHPADGVRGYEAAYTDMAKELGIDYENEDKIPFDATDPEFMEAYFKYLHHPNEEDGVDFWWLDWQQGTGSAIPGVDTLWLLNHMHFLDSGRDGKRPLTFSRYAGIGSHRYPVGFSGDSVTSWESLQFQPYFTANASNVGYTWWSHDIGGHQGGRRDDELVVRWIQFGVFSPIMRLHSTSNEFYGKEPWNYNLQAQEVITSFMQLRHRLIPYLYTMNRQTAKEGIPLIQPMYYRHDKQKAYEVPNEYYFGSQMIVCPITQQMDPDTLLAEFDAWIPQGTYYDFFTGNVYRGGRNIKLYRGIDQIPVLIPAGGIIPLAADYEDCHIKNPEILELKVYHGGNGQFEMYEDDCKEQQESRSAITRFEYEWDGDKEAVFRMSIQEESPDTIPVGREYRVCFAGVTEPEKVQTETSVGSADVRCEYNETERQFCVCITGEGINSFTINLQYKDAEPQIRDKAEMIFGMLNRMQIEYNLKDQIYRIVCAEKNIPRALASLHELQLGENLYGAIIEILTMEL